MAKKPMLLCTSTALFLQCLFFFFQSVFMLAVCGNNVTDAQALLAFKAAIAWDPLHALSPWNETVHFCSWKGVVCSGRRRDRVVSIDLRSQGLVGSLSPYIGNLSFLKNITLTNNSFTGNIPEEIGRLRHLEYIEFRNNSFEGEIPRNLSQCTNLRSLNLIDNNLTGKIIPEIGFLFRLQALGLSLNRLSGTILPDIGNLTSMHRLSLGNCYLQGQIPESLVQLKNLGFLQLGENNLTGSIPSGLFNSSVFYFDLDSNQLQGKIPPAAGHTLRYIKSLNLAGNSLHGEIPVSLLNASFLEQLSLYANSFTGPVLDNFGKLTNLQTLHLSENNLQGDISSIISSLANCTELKSLAVGNNLLYGSFPDSIANLSKKLLFLSMPFANIGGRLPSGIGYLPNLAHLVLDNNHLSGPVPSSIGKLVKLQELLLSANGFTGEIPLSLGNLTLLGDLDLHRNNISGTIPQSLSNLRSLLTLDLSQNKLNGAIPPNTFRLSSISISFNLADNEFTGPIPPEVGQLRQLGDMDLSNNQLSGFIPKALANCVSLQRLHLEGNSFEGEIPAAISALRGLQDLDLSRNHLSGPIPSFLGELRLLNLNLSDNQLRGQIPSSGVFQNWSAVSVDGNVDLCGGITEFRLPPCTPLNHYREKWLKVLKIVVPTGAITVISSVLTVLFCVRMRKEKSRRKSKPTEPRFRDQFMRLSYGDLLKATGAFSEGNLIGVGRFGSVYKGTLDGWTTEVAVKVLNLDVRRASKTFMTECNVLREVRHRNLVKIMSACVSTDFQGRDFKALVYEYMSNGSLEEWLHGDADKEGGNQRNLTVIQRLNIAIDIASAVEYLHLGTDSTIIHGDLKPKNILLDDDMTAYVGDFGLAKVISSLSKDLAANESSSIPVKGTIGYIAPEYGMGDVSTHGDVYSFGILLLEMFTNIRPTSEVLKDHTNLHRFVSNALPENVMDMIDPIIAREIQVTSDDKAKECVSSILKIGVECSRNLPKDRMGMTNIVNELSKIRTAYLF